MHKIVIKVGTSTLTDGTQKLSRRRMLGLAQQIAHLNTQNIQLILVSSGAVATGRELLNSSIPSKQTCASIGQVKLMQVWTELFALFELQVGQVLLTKDDFSSHKQSLTSTTLNGLWRYQIVPIINENDAVALQDKRIGDNDNLAALVAKTIEADTLILLTDQEGLYTADPRAHPEAQLIPLIEEIDDAITALASGSATKLGTGGMKTKIEAAALAAAAGIRTIIASSARPDVLLDLASGKQIGTLIKGKTNV